MRLRCSETAWRSFLVSTLLCAGAWAKKDAPGVKTTKFEHGPSSLQYFEDSDVVMFEDRIKHIVYRSDDAGESWKPVPHAEGKIIGFQLHPFDKSRAYILTDGKTQWATKDRGKSWEEFFTDSQPSVFRLPLVFHAKDPDRIILNAMDCAGIFCEEITMYTTNGFRENTRFLRRNTVGCHWAVSTPQFTTGDKEMDQQRVLCVVKGRFSPWKSDYRLLVSDNFFTSNGNDIQEFEPELMPGRTVQGIANIAGIKKYLITASMADKTDEMALYVSDDAIHWHRAIFPHDHKLTEEAYTILESTNHSIQIDVMNTRFSNPMGVLFTSNSNGTYFTRDKEHTNRGVNGLVDFENIRGVEGIVMLNTVDNWEEVEKSSKEFKKIQSEISFDGGLNWKQMKAGGQRLHLHSVTELDNSGPVFSSPAPGIVLGNGNTGEHLGKYDDANLYVSDDAGLTWTKALDGPHKYEFGDQGSVLVAIKDEYVDHIKYSLDHGRNWESADLGIKVRPLQLLTTQDSTSLKFLLEAQDFTGKSEDFYLIALDFDGLHESQCKDSDFEEWIARVDEKGEPTCLMGHSQSYRRRKATSKCFLKKEFEDPQVKNTVCTCTDDDFECDFNFARSDGGDKKECTRIGPLSVPEGKCKAFGPDDVFLGSSGYRLIPTNDCKRTDGKQLDDPKEWKCETAAGSPASGLISKTQMNFPGNGFQSVHYLERTHSSSGDDETVVLRNDQGKVWITHNHGKDWEEILKNERIVQIYTNEYFQDVIYFLTATRKVFYSIDRGHKIQSFEAPNPPSHEGPIMSFHPKYKDWIIWLGVKDDHSVASITQDRGDNNDWKTLQRYVRKCEFIKEAGTPQQTKATDGEKRIEKLIYCEVRRDENTNADNPWQLVSSDDFFNEGGKVHFQNIVDFATMSEFIVVATKDDKKQTLNVDTSVDATNFAPATFPHGFEIDHQKAYTVLDSSTHSVFLHVTVNNDVGLEYGSIIKSNSNGTSYVMSLNAVDRDTTGYVDFEKMVGLEGVAMVNVVANYESKNYAKEGKKLKTMITHNDGAEWDYITPPELDADGKKFDCKGSTDKCSLNIHGYTERSDKSHTFYSPSAIGIMMGTGNVGQYLSPLAEADTFMTTDGGIKWKSVKKGSYMWEFGDQGSIIVIVKDTSKTNIVSYTLDEGEEWHDFEFADSPMRILDLTTVPTDTSRNFLLWVASDGGQLGTINLNFEGLTKDQCKLDESDVTRDDYYLWSPKHPKQDDDCLFGHVSQYHRKKVDRKCFNGPVIPHLHNVARNCSCSRRDFECDFNFERQKDGSCALVQGFSPPDHKVMCALDENLIEYYEPTGYRRIPLTTCQSGKEMDISTNVHACPGKKEDFARKYGPGFWGLVFAISVPFAAAGAAGWWVWRNWTGKFGQIRLGEQATFDDEEPYIKYPVMVLAGIVAVAQAAPLLVSSLWRSLNAAFGRGTRDRRFTTRDSFARGGEYANVVDVTEDEGELLGDDSDEEV